MQGQGANSVSLGWLFLWGHPWGPAAGPRGSKGQETLRLVPWRGDGSSKQPGRRLKPPHSSSL